MLNPLNPPYPLIREKLFAGQLVPFLGAGASQRTSCGVWERCLEAPITYGAPPTCYLNLGACQGFDPPPPPDGCPPKTNELACYLARKTAFPQFESLDLAKAAQYFSVAGGHTELYEELHDIFNKDYPFNSLHRLLASVEAPLLVVTTNYDDLIERAFDAEQRPYDVVIHTTDQALGNQILYRKYGAREPEPVIPNKLDIDLNATTVIYKMHGAVDREDMGRDQFVITEDDYIDFLTRMTRGKVIPAVVGQAFQSRPFLFLGYGLRDWNLRVVLKHIEGGLRLPRNRVSWAIQHPTSPLEVRFWMDRGVQVYDMTLEDFVSHL